MCSAVSQRWVWKTSTRLAGCCDNKLGQFHVMQRMERFWCLDEDPVVLILDISSTRLHESDWWGTTLPAGIICLDDIKSRARTQKHPPFVLPAVAAAATQKHHTLKQVTLDSAAELYIHQGQCSGVSLPVWWLGEQQGRWKYFWENIHIFMCLQKWVFFSRRVRWTCPHMQLHHESPCALH